MRRQDLPSGTVTFLFTDVAGSTKLLHELGAEGYAAALAEHRRIVRAACVAAGGVEVDTQGDAFFIAFPTGSGAVAAASAATEALVNGPIRVRVGIHTGRPLLTAEGYVGTDVHRAARIAAAGHGGQVLVSAETAELIERAGLRDLGEHRFKDLAAAERIYQLGEGEFPPLKSLYRVTLPVPQTAFLGRERELAEVAELLARADARLVTLAGPGGTGKTRLALQAAAEASEHFPDGVYWAGLAPLREATLALPTLAQVLGVQEQADRSLLEALADRVGGKRVLVVLDNAEHLLPALAADMAALRAAVPTLTLLVTSRERLQLQGERVYAVPSLAEQEAVELFLERAAALGVVVERSDGLVELCRRLDHLPLALELAAARTAIFSVEQLLERVSERLDLLKGGRDSDPRQQTLRATIEWSYELLDERERLLFARLSVFVGGCTYDAAEDVAGADPDSLQSLLDKSLLRRREGPSGKPRYWMLETIREYALGQLDESEEAALRRRHAAYFLSRAGTEAPELVGRQQPQCLARLRADYDNYRAALFEEQGDAGALLALASNLGRFWYMSSMLEEGGRWLDSALQGANGRSLDYANALYARAVLFWVAGSFDEAEARQHEALRLFRELQHSWGIAEVLNDAGVLAGDRGDRATAEALLEQSRALAIEIAEPWLEQLATQNLADSALQAGDFERATRLATEALDLATASGNDDGAVFARGTRASAHLLHGDIGPAEADFRQALVGARELGRPEAIAWSLVGLGAASLRVGDVLCAARLVGAVERWANEAGVHFKGPEATQLHETVAQIEARSSEEVANARVEGAKEGLDAAAAYALGED